MKGASSRVRNTVDSRAASPREESYAGTMSSPFNEVPTRYKATITLVTMGVFAVAGFLVQQHLIEKYIDKDVARLHVRAKEIHQEEIAKLAAAMEAQAAANQAQNRAQR